MSRVVKSTVSVGFASDYRHAQSRSREQELLGSETEIIPKFGHAQRSLGGEHFVLDIVVIGQ